MKRKTLINLLAFVSLFTLIHACDKKEEDTHLKPNMSFKSGGPYLTQDITLAGGSLVVIGINATKAEADDVMTHFTITESINGAAATTLYNIDLTGSQGDTYFYNFTRTLGTTSGESHKYTFTVTSESGASNQLSMTVTIL